MVLVIVDAAINETVSEKDCENWVTSKTRLLLLGYQRTFIQECQQRICMLDRWLS